MRNPTAKGFCWTVFKGSIWANLFVLLSGENNAKALHRRCVIGKPQVILSLQSAKHSLVWNHIRAKLNDSSLLSTPCSTLERFAWSRSTALNEAFVSNKQKCTNPLFLRNSKSKNPSRMEISQSRRVWFKLAEWFDSLTSQLSTWKYLVQTMREEIKVFRA